MEIYLHIPFCRRKCLYCDFPSISGGNFLFSRYIKAVCREIELRRCDEKITSVYFGGGTPSILPIDLIRKIFSTLGKNFEFDQNIETTIEINPGTVDDHYLEQLRKIGFNRVSIGVQSFDDRLLKNLGRIHSSKTARDVVESAKKFFENISIDLMYALPDESLKNLADDLKIVTILEIQHVSIYGLQIEEGTPFFEMKLNLPSEELSEQMYDLIMLELPRNNFHRYEISNFAKPGFESRHNLGYWSDVEYLGFGSSAHSYLKNDRFENISNVEEYINAVESGKIYQYSEDSSRTRNDLISEFCFLGLRKVAGINRKQFENKFGIPIESIFRKQIDRLIRKQLLIADSDSIRLTDLGFKFGNLAFEEFLL